MAELVAALPRIIIDLLIFTLIHAYSTTVVEFNTTMALVVLKEQCDFVRAGTETEATGHFTL